MNDLISRQKAIDAVRKLYIQSPKINNDFVYNMAIDQAHDTLVNLPSAQSEIIYCRECEYGAQDDEGWWYCIDYGCQVGDKDGSGFCAEGEMRKNGSN